jgi:hypothetical protein
MKSWFASLALTLCASAALAEPPPPASSRERAAALIEKQLVAPMKKSESKRSRFSRAAPVTIQRRVRILDALAQLDARGDAFVRFAIDELNPGSVEGGWERDALLGCAYVEDAKVFVQRGSEYLPARAMLGADAVPQAGVCRPAPQLAQAFPANARD